MFKNKKIVIITIVGLVTAGLSYYFLIYKPAHPKTNIPPPAPDTTPGTGNKIVTKIKSVFDVVFPKLQPTSNSIIGQNAYADRDGVKVLKSDGTTLITLNAGDWAGTITGLEKKGSSNVFTLPGETAPDPYFYVLKRDYYTGLYVNRGLTNILN